MPEFSYTMEVLVFCFLFYFIFPALTLSVEAKAALQNVRSKDGGGFLAKSFLPTPSLNELELSLPVPLQTWNLKDLETSFDLRLMNSSWSGPAETNIYQRGESVHLQVFALTKPDQELYIQSCYVTSSSDPMDKSRSALLLNKGCVSSKQPAIEFISKRHDSINLLLDTSRLKFSQVYVHCSMVFSSAVSPDSKSCNYDQSKSRWVELGGETNVCKCCALKCKGPPSFGGPANEFKALVSTGPLVLKEERHEEPSLTNSFNDISQSGSSTGTNQTTSRSVVLESKGRASMWLPGLLVDVPHPGVEMIDVPQENNTAELGVSIHNAPDEKVVSKIGPSEEILHEARDWKSLIPESISEVYTADSADVMKDWGLGADYFLEGFAVPTEDQQGDVLLNYKWPQHYNNLDASVPLLEKPQEMDHMMALEQAENVVQKLGDEFGNYLKKTRLTFSQYSGGSSSLSYEEHIRSPSVGELEMVGDGSSKKVKDLLLSLWALVSGSSKMLRDQWHGLIY